MNKTNTVLTILISTIVLVSYAVAGVNHFATAEDLLLVKKELADHIYHQHKQSITDHIDQADEEITKIKLKPSLDEHDRRLIIFYQGKIQKKKRELENLRREKE